MTVLRACLAACLSSFWLAGASAASAQEITFQFNNPSFGGNPFNSAHLIAIASVQRPEQKREELSPGELFTRQLQARLFSVLSSSVITAITGSAPGDTGEFVIGDQRITFVRTDTEIRVTIFDETTGETTEIVVPIQPGVGGTPVSPRTSGMDGSAELALMGADSPLIGVRGSSNISSLEGGAVELPIGTNAQPELQDKAK